MLGKSVNTKPSADSTNTQTTFITIISEIYDALELNLVLEHSLFLVVLKESPLLLSWYIQYLVFWVCPGGHQSLRCI